MNSVRSSISNGSVGPGGGDEDVRSMITLPSGKRQCPAGYTQRPRGSGRCLPSRPRSRRPKAAPLGMASPSPALLPSLPSLPPVASLLSPSPIAPLPSLPPVDLASLRSEDGATVRSTNSPPLSALSALPSPSPSPSPPGGDDVRSMITLPSGKRQCPPGYTQRPRGSGRCLPSKPRIRRPPGTVAAVPVPTPPLPVPLSMPPPLPAPPTAGAVDMITLPSGKRQCPAGYAQKPRGSGRCLPSTKKRRNGDEVSGSNIGMDVGMDAGMDAGMAVDTGSITGPNPDPEEISPLSLPSPLPPAIDHQASDLYVLGEFETKCPPGMERFPRKSRTCRKMKRVRNNADNVGPLQKQPRQAEEGSPFLPPSPAVGDDIAPAAALDTAPSPAPSSEPSSSSDGSTASSFEPSSSSDGSSSSSASSSTASSSSIASSSIASSSPTTAPPPPQRPPPPPAGNNNRGAAFAAERAAYQAQVERYREQLERGDLFGAEEDDLFPGLDDPLFAAQLARRAEFANTRYDGSIAPVAQRADEVCAAAFEVLPNQRFTQTLISPDFPVNALYLYNGLGTGKTVNVQGVTEQFRQASKAMGIARPVFIVAAPNVLDNFRVQLFDPAKLRADPTTQALGMPPGTIGEQILLEINPTPHLGQLPREELLEGAKRIIGGTYNFISPTAFAYRVQDLIAGGPTADRTAPFPPPAQIPAAAVARLRARFDNSFVVVDEAHNVNQRGTHSSGVVSAALELVARFCNITLVLMSATPMFNSHRELVPVVNLLNLVDRRAPVSAAQVFDAQGNFVAPEGGREGGRDLLARKLTGYVSYVRGESPYAFPFRLLPDSFLDMNDEADARHRLLPENYPALKLNGRPVTEPLKFIQVFASAMPPYQQRVYLALIQQHRAAAAASASSSSTAETSSDGDATGSSSLTNGGSGSGSGNSTSEEEEEEEALDGDADSSSSGSSSGGVEIDLAALPDSVADVADERQEGYNYTILHPLLNASAIVYPHPDWGDDRDADNATTPAPATATPPLRQMTGPEGLRRYMKWEGRATSRDRDNAAAPMQNFRYSDPAAARIFSPDQIGAYSAKIASAVERVRRSTGIVIIYSFFLESCLIPLALALEQAGLVGVEGTGDPADPVRRRMLWHPDELQRVRPLLVDAADGGGGPVQATYTMVTGRRSLSPNNAASVALAAAAANAYGRQVKVVLFTSAGAESVDYKFVRQVHVMEPWFNFNRMEQVVGRGVRNRSHCGLPFALRNTEVYYHAAVLAPGGSADEERSETADLYMYRWCEAKELVMARARRVMKECSVDCITNRGQQDFTLEQMDQQVELELPSGGGRRIVFAVGDRPFSNLCDYMESCHYQCYVPAPLEAAAAAAAERPTSATYGPRALRRDEARLVRRIQDLFREKTFFSFPELRARLTTLQRIPEEHIYAAVQALLRDPALLLVNGAGLRGRMVAVEGEGGGVGAKVVWYMFQPLHVTDRAATVFERGALAPDKPSAVRFVRGAPAAAADGTAAAAAADGAVAAADPAAEEAERARLAPQVLAYLLAVVVFGQREAAAGLAAADRAAVVAAAGSVTDFWYKTLRQLVQLQRQQTAATAAFSAAFLARVTAEHFLDSRPAAERAWMLRALAAAGALPETGEQVEALRRAAAASGDAGGYGDDDEDGGADVVAEEAAPSADWPTRVRGYILRYFADRLYVRGPARVAVLADMTQTEPRLVAAVLTAGEEEAEGGRLRLLEEVDPWVAAAARARHRAPEDLVQRVRAARRAGRGWPVLIPSLKNAGKKFQPGGWEAAMTLRVKMLTDTRPNMNGGKVFTTVGTTDAAKLWGDLQAISPCGPEWGAAALQGKAGMAAAATFALLLVKAHEAGCYSAISGEAFALSSLATDGMIAA